MPINDRKFLIFLMNGQRYAVDLVHVAEVMDSVVSWPIPLAPSCYSGVINFHGAIVAVMDLAVFLGFNSSLILEKIIVLDVNVASLGFWVERVTRIVPEIEIEIHEAPDVCFALSSLRLPEGSATLIDVDAIVKKAEITMNV